MRKAGRVSPVNGLCCAKCSNGEQRHHGGETRPGQRIWAGLEEQKIDRKVALQNHIVYDLVCDTLCHKPKSIQKDRCVNTQRSFCGAPDWIRTSGLPGRSRTLYPTELRTHMYEKRRSDEFQLFGCKWSNSSQATTKTKIEMPKNGLVMRFSDYTRAGVGVVGAERSIQLSYGRIATFYRCRQYNTTLFPRGQVLF